MAGVERATNFSAAAKGNARSPVVASERIVYLEEKRETWQWADELGGSRTVRSHNIRSEENTIIIKPLASARSSSNLSPTATAKAAPPAVEAKEFYCSAHNTDSALPTAPAEFEARTRAQSHCSIDANGRTGFSLTSATATTQTPLEELAQGARAKLERERDRKQVSETNSTISELHNRSNNTNTTNNKTRSPSFTLGHANCQITAPGCRLVAGGREEPVKMAPARLDTLNCGRPTMANGQQKRIGNLYSNMDTSASSEGAQSSSLLRPASNLNLLMQPVERYYDENLLLYATEHEPRAQNNAKQQATLVKLSLPPQQLVSSARGPAARSAHRRRPANAKERARSAVPMGRYVSAYPNCRQPAHEASSPATQGQQQPYAFHVPAYWQRAAPLGSSPSPTYTTSTSGLHLLGQQQQQQQLANSANRSAAIRQARYGYVARDCPRNEWPQVAKFNQSLRSRTIEHLPSMVQVSLAEGQARPELPCARHVFRTAAPPPPLAAGQENPFKPGTELSWEADLMVRLIKRGYPMGDLSQLVAAAKEARGWRTARSCERLTSAPAAPTATAGAPQIASSGLQTKADSRRQKAATLGGAANKDDRQLWASSLSRAGSAPRLLQLGAAAAKHNCADKDKDADSLDRLIASIEQEISELLAGEQSPEQRAHFERATRTLESTTNGNNAKSVTANRRLVDELVTTGGLPQAKQSKLECQTSNAGSPSATKLTKANLSRSKSDSELLEPKRGLSQKKRKRKGCCRLQ